MKKRNNLYKAIQGCRIIIKAIRWRLILNLFKFMIRKENMIIQNIFIYEEIKYDRTINKIMIYFLPHARKIKYLEKKKIDDQAIKTKFKK